jgi:hypothetical protein
MLKRTFEVKKDEVIGGWRKLHKEELHKLYSSPNVIRMMKSIRMRWARYVTCMKRIHVGFWWEKPERKKPLGRSRHWQDNNVELLL